MVRNSLCISRIILLVSRIGLTSISGESTKTYSEKDFLGRKLETSLLVSGSSENFVKVRN